MAFIFLQRRNKRCRGQAMAEYLMLTALVAVGSIAVVQILGSNIRRKLTDISNAIGGNPSETRGLQAQEKHYQVQDMNDFTTAIQNNGQND